MIQRLTEMVNSGRSRVKPVPGQVYARPDGSRVRVDDVKHGKVYYVAWRPGQDVGNPIRMIITDFMIAIREELMVPSETYRCVSCGDYRIRPHHGTYTIDTPSGAVERGCVEINKS